jgi:hypothetical protein
VDVQTEVGSVGPPQVGQFTYCRSSFFNVKILAAAGAVKTMSLLRIVGCAIGGSWPPYLAIWKSKWE